MDTALMEYTAEDLIAHKLQRAKILVAKPKFAQEGADLLALLGVSDGAKFCRIQCKGRSLVSSSTAHVEIPRRYVSDAFIVFLFVDTGSFDETHLFCFLGTDIKANWKLTDDQYRLIITKSQFATELSKFVFSDQKIHEIKKVIVNVDVQGEFNKVVCGYFEATLDNVTMSATGEVGNAKSKSDSSV